MRWSFVAQSFLPFALRFCCRHPTKLDLLKSRWSDYAARFGKVAELTGKDVDQVKQMFYEIECQTRPSLERKGWAVDPIHYVTWYALVRLMRPDIVVETGVAEGYSSFFILLAMARNRHGVLHSIDFPGADLELGPGMGRQAYVLPAGRSPGWQVPEDLRSRWQLHLGDAKDLLPPLLKRLGSIDIFIHDSLHSYDHMLFEFTTAWPHLRERGLMLSDDTDWNNAFTEFSSNVQGVTVMFNYRVGAISKMGSATVSG